MTMLRTRWAAIGAAVAVTLGAGGVAMVSATSPADAVTLVPITPCRVTDTRPSPDNVGPRSTPIGADETYTVDAIDASDDAGQCAGLIPTSATAIALNVTTVGATAGTFLTIWDGSDPRPLASSLNPAPGQPPTPNAVTTDLNSGGEFSIYNLAGTVDVLADITGYYTDHHHDDRYYTEDEVDAALADLENDVTTELVNIDDELLERPTFVSIIRLVSGSNGYTVEQGADPGFTVLALGPSRFEIGLTSGPARSAMESANCTSGFSGLETFQVYKSVEFGSTTTAELQLVQPDGSPLSFNGRALYCTIWG